MNKLKANVLILIAFVIIMAAYLIFGDTGVLFLKGPVSSTVVSVNVFQGEMETPMGRLLKGDVVRCVVDPLWGSFAVYMRCETGETFTTAFRDNRWQVRIPEDGEYDLVFASEGAAFDVSITVYTKP